MLNENPTQELRVLEVLKERKPQWTNTRYFERVLMLSQFHRALHNLIKRRDKYDYVGEIVVSPDRDEFGFCSYRLEGEPEQVRMKI